MIYDKLVLFYAISNTFDPTQTATCQVFYAFSINAVIILQGCQVSNVFDWNLKDY